MENNDYILKIRPSHLTNLFYYLILTVFFFILWSIQSYVLKYSALSVYHLNELFLNKETSFIRSVSYSITYFITFIPVILGFYKFLSTQMNTYLFYEDRLVFLKGVLNRHQETIEYYRVKDHFISRPIYLRLFGLSTITFLSTDRRHPRLSLKGFRKVNDFEPQFRNMVEKAKDTGKGREIDMV